MTHSSCFSPSLVVTSISNALTTTIVRGEHRSTPSPCSQKVPRAVSLLRAALVCHTWPPTAWYFPDNPNLEGTALLNSKSQLVVSTTTENTVSLSSYHWSNLVSINSAFQNQEKQRTGQFVVRRAENMTTAGFPFKFPVLSDSGLMFPSNTAQTTLPSVLEIGTTTNRRWQEKSLQPHNCRVRPQGDGAPRSSCHAGPGTGSNSGEQKDMQFFPQIRSYPSFGEFALGGQKGEGRSIQIVG